MSTEDPSKQKRKLPEFIIIDEDDVEVQTEEEYAGGKRSSKAPDEKVSWKFRVMCFFVSFMTMIWCVVTFAAALLAAAINLVTFNSFPPIKAALRVYWSWCCGAAVLTLGLLVAVLNFPLGMVIILFYFSEQKPGWQKDMVSRLVKPHAKDYWKS